MTGPDRTHILESLKGHQPYDEREEYSCRLLVDLLKDHQNCFYRTLFNPGHVTGSALLISADGRRVLMNHHKSLDKWLCFGGHADGEEDILNVALRETIEESSIENIALCSDGLWDVDVHPIPANPLKEEPDHKHYDVRYLFRVTDAQYEGFTLSDESVSLRWCTYQEALDLIPPSSESGMYRLLKKWHAQF